MKNLKKIMSMLLVAAMIIAVCGSITAFAETQQESKPTISFSEIMKSVSNGGVEEEEGDIDVPFYPTVSLVRISVTALPTKVIYEQGEELSMEGAEVTAYYNDNSSKLITSYTVSGYDANTPGEQTITVTFGRKTATFTVTVTEVPAVLVGDADGNGVVDGMDATLLLQYAAGWNVKLGK